MNKQQFIIMALFTAAETYFFNEALDDWPLYYGSLLGNFTL